MFIAKNGFGISPEKNILKNCADIIQDFPTHIRTYIILKIDYLEYFHLSLSLPRQCLRIIFFSVFSHQRSNFNNQ